MPDCAPQPSKRDRAHDAAGQKRPHLADAAKHGRRHGHGDHGQLPPFDRLLAQLPQRAQDHREHGRLDPVQERLDLR